jgi:preprotein translocase subunit SecE
MERLKIYLQESYNELVHKVTWPSYAKLQQNTILVIAGSVIFALLILVMDIVSSQVTDFIYGID